MALLFSWQNTFLLKLVTASKALRQAQTKPFILIKWFVLIISRETMTAVVIEHVLKVFVVNSAILPVAQPMDAQKGCVLNIVVIK